MLRTSVLIFTPNLEAAYQALCVVAIAFGASCVYQSLLCECVKRFVLGLHASAVKKSQITVFVFVSRPHSPPSPFRASERPALPVLTLSPPPSAVCLKMLLHNSLPLVLLLKTSRKRLGCSGWLSTSACFDVPGMSDGCPMDVQQVWVRIHSKRRLSARSIREPPLLCGVSSTS